MNKTLVPFVGFYLLVRYPDKININNDTQRRVFVNAQDFGVLSAGAPHSKAVFSHTSKETLVSVDGWVFTAR